MTVDLAREIAAQLFMLYVALAFVPIGFALMLGGPLLMRRTARFFFVRPVVLLGRSSSRIAARVLRGLWFGAGRLLAGIGRATILYGVDPLVRFAYRVFDRIVAGR